MKKNTTPSAKAAQKQKETVRALSMNEVEEALTKSTYGGKKLEPLDEDDIIIAGIEEENRKLRETIRELRAINEEWSNSDEQKLIKELKDDKEILKTECLSLNEEKKQLERHIELSDEEIAKLKEEQKKHLREIDDYKKTISKMKYAHEEEVRALEDELAEAKVLGKKAGEYSEMLDADSDTFEKILDLTDSLKCQVHAMRGVLGLIGSEVEGKI